MRFFKNIRVFIKITGGFSLVLLLLMVVAGEGINNLNDSSTGFSEYRNLARDTNLAGRMQANLLLTRIGALKYMSATSQQALDQYNERSKLLDELVDRAQKNIENPKRASLVDTIETNIDAYHKQFLKFSDYAQKKESAIATMVSDGEKILEGLDSLSVSARKFDDLKLISSIEQSKAGILQARLITTKFLYINKDSESGEKALNAFENVRSSLKRVQNSLYNDEERSIFSSINKSYDNYLSSINSVIESTIAMHEAEMGMNTIGPKIATAIEDVKLSVMSDQNTLGTRMRNMISSAVSNMTIVSAIALVAGIILAFLISRAITAPLKKASTFAQEMARGNFNSKIDVDQKDEVGIICNDMKKIAMTLKEVMEEFDHTVDEIEEGKISSRGDEGEFRGGFKGLINRTNRMIDVLVSFIDSVPMPIMTVDRDLNMLFMNNAGTELLGKDITELQRGKCSDFINADSCNTGDCPCKKTVQSGETVHGRTMVSLNGRKLDIDFIGIPIEKDEKIVGSMELLIDQTRIRAAQTKMQNVAERAQGISEQLSSASEELATQVEQVSRGSEIQGQRLVETATAMEQMNNTIEEVARNASNASGKSGEAKEQATGGAEIVSRAVEAITGVHAIAGELRENMTNLGTQTESISTVMNVITDIADQTNLLALNAAIEAARAGEAGRGFAVVADEVRKLAEKTMDATHEVGKSIEAIQISARVNMESVEKAVEAVDNSTSLAKESGNSLNSIVSIVEDSANQVESIATASEEQSSASEQINQAISEINTVAQDNAQGISQSAQAVQELAVMSNELNELISELTTD